MACQRYQPVAIVAWRASLWNLVVSGLLLISFVLCFLWLMIASKGISLAAVQTVITEERLGTIGHVIVFLTMWTILMSDDVHVFARILSMMHVARGWTMCSTSSQCTESTMPSTASKWDLILMAFSCVLSLTSCILYSMVSSCMFLSHSRNVWAPIRWQCLTGWHLYLISLAYKLFVKTFPELTSYVASPTKPFLSA